MSVPHIRIPRASLIDQDVINGVPLTYATALGRPSLLPSSAPSLSLRFNSLTSLLCLFPSAPLLRSLPFLFPLSFPPAPLFPFPLLLFLANSSRSFLFSFSSFLFLPDFSSPSLLSFSFHFLSFLCL